MTLEVMEVLRPQLDNMTSGTYAFSRALQAPVLDMRTRGVLVDQARKAEVIDLYFNQLDQLERQLDRIVLDGVGRATFNWRSHADLKDLFYNDLGIPPIRKHGSPTADRSARDRLDGYLIARQIVRHINLMADIGKKIGVLRTAIDPDGRIRTSYNIAGTSTGRFSSSVSEFGTGGNLQNIEESLRSVYVADPGYKFAKLDAKSGESFCVGAIEWNLFRDGRYLDACASGDPHTAAARLCWPGLPWTGDIKKDKDIAEVPFYRHHSYRQSTKKLGHASNYAGQPNTIATQTGMPEGIVRTFQSLYFPAFPAHHRWHEHVESEIHSRGMLVSLTGRKRYFMGRRNDPSTLREAIAFDPQGSLADIVNQGMLQAWRLNIAQLMMQDHDATTWQYPEHLEDKIIPQLKAALAVPVELAGGRTMTIPYDCKTGWNKADWSEANPEGLKDYGGTETRRRSAPTHFLDRLVRRAHR